MTPEFWKGRRVFITGHTGFKGGWLSIWLQKLGAELMGYALAPPTTPSLFELAHVADGMVSQIGDIRDLQDLQQAIAGFAPEIVLHLAAQPLVRRSYREPVFTYATNIMGTVNLLEAVRHCESVRAVVNITSDKCYENRELERGYREDDPMGGYDPYASSKGCAELVTAAYRQSFFSDSKAVPAVPAVATARGGNVIGGGDWAEDRLVPDIMQAFLAGHPAVIRRPEALRPWQHVLEPLHGYLLLAEKLAETGQTYAAGWNFGPEPDDSRTVRTVAETLVSLWGDNASVAFDPPADQPHETHLLMLDSRAAKTSLGWIPFLELDEALSWTVEWYQAYRKDEDLRSRTESQIEKFQELIS